MTFIQKKKMWINNQDTPDWVLNQQNNLIHNERWGNITQNQARHMCYAFAAVSVLIKFELDTTIPGFADQAGYDIGVGGIPFGAMRDITNHHSVPLLNSDDSVRGSNNNRVIEGLNQDGSCALISCKHQSAQMSHVFIMCKENNQIRLYNVWNGSRFDWNGSGNPMDNFPNSAGTSNPFIPKTAQVYWE